MFPLSDQIHEMNLFLRIILEGTRERRCQRC